MLGPSGTAVGGPEGTRPPTTHVRTRVHTQVRPLHPQTQGEAEVVSVSSSISGGKAVCGRASPYFRGAGFFLLTRETDLRGTGCISCSHHLPLLPGRQWERGTWALATRGRTGASGSWSFNSNFSRLQRRADSLPRPATPHIMPRFCGELRNS